jgi:hypothetical protein
MLTHPIPHLPLTVTFSDFPGTYSKGKTTSKTYTLATYVISGLQVRHHIGCGLVVAA